MARTALLFSGQRLLLPSSVTLKSAEIKVNIFHLTLPADYFTGRSSYDCMISCVVVADSSENARKIASFHAGDEGKTAWTKHAEVSLIGWAPVSAFAEMICRDFHHG